MSLSTRGSGGERGAVAVFTAIVSVAILVVAALAVDLGNTWARRGQLQVQADRAATYAAQYLPADNDVEYAKVAKAAAYYLACHPVAGQKELNLTLPACPADPESPTLDSYAATLLTSGMVTIPVRNQVRVTTPKARIDFGFGGAAGADGSIQQKLATAKVTSPGLLSPMALSLDCMLQSSANVLNGAAVPFGYISTTHKGGAATASGHTWVGATGTSPTSIGIDPGVVTQQLMGSPPSVKISGAGWPDPFPTTVTVAFGLGLQELTASGTFVPDAGKNKRRLGSVTVALPPAVVGPTGVGTWDVKVQTGSVTPVRTISTATLQVNGLVDTASDVSCGRLLKSPRGGTQANANFALNLQEGLDHLITQHPGIVDLPNATTTDLLTFLQSGTAPTCDSGTADTNGSSSQTPNCVVTKMSNAYEAGFTEGLIGASGRLTCTTPCGRSFSLNGRSVNDDKFTDYVRDTSLLTSSTFFSADTFLTTGLPVVTPTSNLSRTIYDSRRFMWVAVISTMGATSAVQAGDYPVLTFRPIFITQESALTTDNLPLIPVVSLPLATTIAVAISTIDLAMKSHLQPGLVDQHGLLMDGTQVSAVRFLTINPDALPAIPADYAGAESEYLGVGPRIIRLVE